MGYVDAAESQGQAVGKRVDVDAGADAEHRLIVSTERLSAHPRTKLHLRGAFFGQ
jgi:hypothetical protein